MILTGVDPVVSAGSPAFRDRRVSEPGDALGRPAGGAVAVFLARGIGGGPPGVSRTAATVQPATPDPVSKDIAAIRGDQGATSFAADDRELGRGSGRLVDLDPQFAPGSFA